MKPRSLVLDQDVEMLLEQISMQYRVPNYKTIKIMVEDNNLVIDSAKPKIILSALKTIPEYADEYDRLKNSGYGWINLQAAGIYKDILICIIEYPNQFEKAKKTSINFSGPFRNRDTGEYDWDVQGHFEVIL